MIKFVPIYLSIFSEMDKFLEEKQLAKYYL